jgi:hypothetical protein
VPGVGVVQLLPTASPGVIGAGAFVPAGSAGLDGWAAALVDHAELAGRSAGPLARMVARGGELPRTFDQLAEHSPDWDLAVAHGAPLERRLMQRGLSLASAPPAVQRARSRRLELLGFDDVLVKEVERGWTGRGQQLAANLAAGGAQRQICAAGALEAYLEHPDRPAGYWDLAHPGPAAARDHVDHVLALLDRFPDFELAIIPDDEYERLAAADWEVRSGPDSASVTMTAYDPDESAGDVSWVDVVSEDPLVTKAFAAYFEEVWSSLAPRRRDRRRVMGALRAMKGMADAKDRRDAVAEAADPAPRAEPAADEAG